VPLNEVNASISEAACKLDYSIQGLTFTIFEAHHIHLSQGAWFVPDFYNHSAGLAGRPDFFLVFWPSSKKY
jgi:hypothetical protein